MCSVVFVSKIVDRTRFVFRFKSLFRFMMFWEAIPNPRKIRGLLPRLLSISCLNRRELSRRRTYFLSFFQAGPHTRSVYRYLIGSDASEALESTISMGQLAFMAPPLDRFVGQDHDPECPTGVALSLSLSLSLSAYARLIQHEACRTTFSLDNVV